MPNPSIHLLLFEDNPADILLIQKMLAQSSSTSAKLSAVERLADGLERLGQESFDLVLLDLDLPDSQGLETLVKLREQARRLPIVVLTDLADETLGLKALQAGAQDYLAKGQIDGYGLARAVRHAIERKRTEETIRQRVAQMALINTIGGKIAALLDLDSVLQSSASLVQENFGYHHVALFLVENEMVRLKAVAGAYKAYFPEGHSQKLSEGIIGWVARSGGKMVVNDVQTEPKYISLIADKTVTRSELCLPIKVADKVVGILDIQSPQTDAFSENDVLAIETLTHQVAAAIENARLFQTVQKELAERKRAEAETLRRNRELTLLNEIIAASASGLEPEIVLEVACRELALVFDLPQTMATLITEKKTMMLVVAEYRAKGRSSMLGSTIPITRNSFFQAVLKQEGPLIINNTLNDPYQTSLHGLPDQSSIVSLLVLPLRIDGEVVGMLSLESPKPHFFLGEDINLAWSVADQVAGALARARMAQIQKRLSTAVEQSADSVIITDVQGTVLYVNPIFERISGYSQAEIIGQTPSILKSGQHDVAFYEGLWATLTAGRVWRGRFINRRKDGSLYTEDATITPVRDESGIIINYVSVQHDVTRELQLEEQYHQAQKMEAIGRLSSGVAHDFNNLLVVITGYSELLLNRYLNENDPWRKYIEEIKKAGERATKLTQQLLAFSRKHALQLKVFDLNGVVTNMEKMLLHLIGEDIELVTKLSDDLGEIKADPGQMEQIILNLVVNARDAMPQGGKLIIETANVELDETYAYQYTKIKPGLYVMLAVNDTGIGMDVVTQARIFEPFFTTKEYGKGTGLGLATVYSIVKQSDGEIWTYSELGKGTTFKIYLPRVDEVVSATERQIGLAELPRGNETVLLVEDEENVRILARQVLKLGGYTVLEASHGDEACLLAEQYKSPIHLLLTDVIMPHMSGRELAERLILSHSGIKILYMSGYTDDSIVRHGVLESSSFFLQKPFTPTALLHKIREVLNTG